jgi:hypothetical protein
MQIDFHHGVTYVVARLAGFEHLEAEVIAYAAQYVDDATNSGVVAFSNGAMYERMSSAHRTLDYRNFEELANHRVWIPFHFLPGNGGMPAGASPPGTFIDKLRCLPDSPVARDMVRTCIAARGAPSGLYRLGITMHVYADTWAHQGFAGVNHEVNHARHLTGADRRPDHSMMNRLMNYFVSEALPLGHGAVLSNPDKPWLVWGYTNGRGEVIVRDNPTDFVLAADAMCRAMRRFRVGDADADVPGLPPHDRGVLEEMIRGIHEHDGEQRHRLWLEAIAGAAFSFGRGHPLYVDKGEGSWKCDALGTAAEEDDEDEVFTYSPAFMHSHWKLFHDALQEHRFDVLHHILPRYGICAA